MNIYRTFWFEFEAIDKPTPLNLGCGVTAYDSNDAVQLIQQYVFGNQVMPKISRIREDVDMTKLEKNHVAPNIGLTSVRGIWFPQGYTEDINL